MQGLPSYIMSDIQISPEGQVYLGTYEGIYRMNETNSGWFPANGNLLNSNMTEVLCGPDNTMLAHSGVRLFRSTDDGLLWQEIPGAADGHVIRRIKISGNTWLMIIYNGDWENCSYCHDLRVSTDGGISWTSAISGTLVHDAVQHPDGDLIAVTPDGIMLSADAGLTWSTHVTEHQTFTALTVDSSGTLFAGNALGIYRSTDKGYAWENIAPQPEGDSDMFTELHIDSQGRLYTVAEYYSGGEISYYLHRLADAATGTWEAITPFGESTFSDFHIDAHDNLLAVTGYGIFRSTDQGNTWQLIAESAYQLQIRAVTSSPEVRLFAAFADAGIHLSDTYVSARPPITPDQATSHNSLRAHPNPATTGIFLVNPRQQAGTAVPYNLFDLRGTLITRGLLPSAGLVLDLSAYSPGTYTVQSGGAQVKVVVVE